MSNIIKIGDLLVEKATKKEFYFVLKIDSEIDEFDLNQTPVYYTLNLATEEISTFRWPTSVFSHFFYIYPKNQTRKIMDKATEIISDLQIGDLLFYGTGKEADDYCLVIGFSYPRVVVTYFASDSPEAMEIGGFYKHSWTLIRDGAIIYHP